MPISARLLLALFVCAVPMAASAQVFRCADGAGKVQFSDRPCDAGHKSSEVRIYKRPDVPAPRMSTEATTRGDARQVRQESGDDSHQRIQDATDKIRQMRAENYDPRKCAELRGRMARIERRDPLLFKIDIDHTMSQQQASLYCGN